MTEMQEAKNKTKHTQKNQRNKIKKEKRKVKVKLSFFALLSLANWRRIIHLQSPSKLTEKQMDKVRLIIHSKFRCSIFRLRRIIFLARII